jgi:hypothetical protein
MDANSSCAMSHILQTHCLWVRSCILAVYIGGAQRAQYEKDASLIFKCQWLRAVVVVFLS